MPPDSGTSSADVIIVGGGPAGATAAIELARRGRRVVLFEKDRHPRFHIGESLLPASMHVFEHLGVAERMAAIGMPKWGAEFVSPWHDHTETFEFAEAWDKSRPMAYQVRRSEFDEILIRRAAECGVDVREGCRAREVILPDAAHPETPVSVTVEHSQSARQTWSAPWLIDASGRDTLLGTQLGQKLRNARHNSAAMYGHFRGAHRDPDCHRAGNIAIFWFEHGWHWFIPLRDGITSVGSVVWPYYMKRRDKPLREYFLETVAQSPALAQRLGPAQLVSDVQATGNYAYACTRTHGHRWLLVGDAYAFVDPMFSSGVMLALQTGLAGAAAVDECLTHPARARRALRHFDRLLRRGPAAYSWFIYRVTNPCLRDLFMAPRNLLRMKEAMLSLLAGDVYGASPIGPSLGAFKAVYYLLSIAHAPRSIAAARRRRTNIRPPRAHALTSE